MDEARTKTEEPDGWTGSWCTLCGPDVRCDEDGCCAGCGTSCLGEGAEAALKMREAIISIGVLLGENGCDCECDHSWEEHDEDCERCLACKIDRIVSTARSEVES